MDGLGGPILGTALGIVGSFFGLGALGFAVGNLIGNILFPPSAPDAPELGDLGINTYVRSAPVPIVYGLNRVYGGVIWIGNNSVEMENEGNSKNPAYSAIYYAEFAMAVSEGPIYSFDTIYINDKDISELTEDDAISLDWNWYWGWSYPTQTLDPYISAYLGSDAIPFVHTAYIVGEGKIGRQNSLPTLSVDIRGLQCTGTGNEPSPISVLYDFLTNKRYGCGLSTDLLDGSPTTSGTWKDCEDFCNVSILNGDGVYESRFKYSNVFNQKIKAYDIINDILQTCRGFLYYSDGLLKVKIGRNDEVPVFHFAENLEVTFSTGGSCTVDRIYADFSSYITGFFNGDHGQIELNGVIETFIVINQTSTYIDLASSLSDAPSSSVFFNLYKDNITKDSFSFQRRADLEINNRIRIEFINYNDDYRIDYVETDDTYNMNLSGEIKEQTYTMRGIKRKSQASRMAAFYLDCATCIEFLCEFDTDICGYFLTLSDIITVTHPAPNFNMKYFRIVGMEELQDFSVKLSLVEYVPTVYHDGSISYTATESYKLPNIYAKPKQVERFMVFEDGLTNTLKFGFKRGDDDSFWSGVNLYIYDAVSSSYQFVSFQSNISPSVKLNAAIDENDTDIYYDPDTVYGSFPASGVIFIEDEEIYYSSIDDLNDKFESCTRGYNNTVAASHADTEYCVYKSYNMPSYTFSESQIGTTLTFKAVSINVSGLVADPLAAPTDAILIQGKYLAPPSVGSLQINSQGNDTTLVASDDAVLTWDLVTQGINKGYGYDYGDDEGYGNGVVEGVTYFVIKVYKTSGLSLLRTVTITDLTSPTYNYTSAYNISDNGSYEEDLTFYVYQVSSGLVYSSPSILITNI